MEMKEKVMDTLRSMDHIVLRPHLSLGYSAQNNKSGKISGPKTITFSASTTLFRAALMILSLILAARAMMCLMRMKQSWKIRRKYRAKMKRHKKAKAKNFFPKTKKKKQ